MNKDALQSPQLEITYYTDPLCCWSWAFEPHWRKLLEELKGRVRYRYCMGGLLPGWKNYNDAINSVTRPIQMGPVWMHAKHVSGMPVDYNIWMRDPPSSSYPACIAVKCAAMQSGRAEENYLRSLREAVMADGQNIAKQQVLFDVADILAANDPTFDAFLFKKHFKNEEGLEAFRKDLHEVQYRHINRFPSLIVKNQQNGVVISGYRPFAALQKAIEQLTGEDTPEKA